jgi:hypothetical protein
MGVVACDMLFVQARAPSMLDSYLLGEELAKRLDSASFGLGPAETALLRTCLPAVSLEPSNRYPTALAFLDQLEKAAATHGIGPSSVRAVGALVEGVARARGRDPVAPSFPTNPSKQVRNRAGG